MNNADASRFMRHAADLALRGRGPTAPNPCVGAVLVKDGAIVAEGWHQQYGKPHAEPNCLADARTKGIDPSECTMFVTLEPCNHHGKTPPCSKAVFEAGVREVFIGTLDPNPKAEGGATFLRDKGVIVHTGAEEQACRDLTADFRVWQFTQRPYVVLKMASTLDGRIACRSGHSKWISGEESRRRVHEIRSYCGAVIVGGGTFRADDPRLTVRSVAESGNQPLAVVVTSQLPEANAYYYLLRERADETIFWTTPEAAQSQAAEALKNAGCRVWGIANLEQGLIQLRSECGVWHVLCEGGGSLALSFIQSGLMDEFQHFVAPKIIGDSQAPGVFEGRAPLTMDDALNLRTASVTPSGDDTLIVYRPQED